MGVSTQQLDRFLARLASRQRGVAARTQLLGAGFTRRLIERKIASGALIPVHPGVYLVGHRATSPLAFEAAAILACRPDALLSRFTAARLHGFRQRREDAINVLVAGRARRSLPGVVVHRISELHANELRRHEGLPLTSPALTLLDLAGVSTEAELARDLNEARVMRLVSDFELEAVLGRHPKRRGARALRAVLAAERGPLLTESEAEARALRAMKRAGLVPDATQHGIGPYRVDFWFERERVAVEVEGFGPHATPARFTRDRRRTAYLAARGVLVFPLTWQDVVAPGEPMRRLSQTLASRS